MSESANATLAGAIAHLRGPFDWLLDEFVRGRLLNWISTKLYAGKLPALDASAGELSWTASLNSHRCAHATY